MRLLKRTLRMFIVALLAMVFAFSMAACKTRSGNHAPDDPDESQEGSKPEEKPDGGDDDGDEGEEFTPPDDGSEGIDWTNYWDGLSNTGSGADNFKFTASKEIGTVEVTPDDSTSGGATESESLTVTFNSDGGDSVAAQSVENGGIAVKPATPEKSGYMFTGWTENNKAYDFSTPVTANKTLTANWAQLSSGIVSVKGYFESIAVEFSGTASTTVQYRLNGASDWSTVDAQLVRAVSGGNIRADVVGLKAGDYELKVGETVLPAPVSVEAYDRSGYAHFSRSTTETAYTGIGAYKDDGTIKDNTLVIYVTEENKNTVKTGYVNGSAVDLTPYLWQGKAGIGWILNNRGYDSNTSRENYGIQKLTNVYGAVAVRFIGKVNAEESTGKISLIDGLTDYNSTGNGGSVGDNGRMARITNAKNLTIEGIGDDACIYGWGIHFVSNDNLHKYKDSGTSFEVRNLTFQHYPEDAIGMEGTQGTKVDNLGSITSGASSADSDLISPVERCWVHNNTFMQGYSSAPAESDKSDGDGSCDFKRGQYYTLSYNYFEECHKTNLIGSADTSLTYNVTIHHNWYKTVQSRQPLARRANIHYYNNYVSDASDYVTSFRANCLVFSEANYYDGCKNVTQKKDGVGVAWNNVYYACYSENLYTELTSRTQTVTNSCKFIYRNIDYSQFYINSNLFYYDSVNKASDCLLDSAVGARVRVMQYAGVNGFGLSSDDTVMNEYTPSSAVAVSEQGVTVDLTKVAKGSSTVSNVAFNGITGVSSGVIKGKGQIITFTITAPAEVKITTTTTGDPSPELVDSYGKVWAAKFNGTLTIVLPKGTYFVETGQKDKEAQISALSFEDTEASSQARIAEAKSALAAIPSSVTLNDHITIHAAQLAYSALLSAEREQISDDLYKRYLQAETAYAELQVEYVIARIEYIGTVDSSSYNKINAAQTAYDELPATQKGQITNYSKLTAAWETYGQFAAQNVIDRILDLPDLSEANVKSRESLALLNKWYEAVQSAFESLTSEEGSGQQGTVMKDDGGKTYAHLTDGLAHLNQIENLFDFKDALAEADADNVTLADGAALRALHENLSETYKAKLTADEVAKYETIHEAYENLANQTQICSFDGAPSNGMFTVSGSYYTGSMTINGETYAKGLKMESSTSVTFATETKMVLTLYLHSSCNGKVVEIDGVPYTATTDGSGNVVIEVELEAGDHKISKGSKGTTNTYIYVAILSPAS